MLSTSLSEHIANSFDGVFGTSRGHHLAVNESSSMVALEYFIGNPALLAGLYSASLMRLQLRRNFRLDHHWGPIPTPYSDDDANFLIDNEFVIHAADGSDDFDITPDGTDLLEQARASWSVKDWSPYAISTPSPNVKTPRLILAGASAYYQHEMLENIEAGKEAQRFFTAVQSHAYTAALHERFGYQMVMHPAAKGLPTFYALKEDGRTAVDANGTWELTEGVRLRSQVVTKSEIDFMVCCRQLPALELELAQHYLEA